MALLAVQVSKCLRPACSVMSTPARIRTACYINMVNLALGAILAGSLRSHKALTDTVTLLVFLGVSVGAQARMYHLATRFTDNSAEDVVLAHVQQANFDV